MDSILKAINDKTIKIVACPENNENLSFTIQGSSIGKMTIYTVKFDKNITCTCKDHTINKNMCKHIYFVYLKVFRMPIGNGTCTINDSQLKVLKNIYTNFQRKTVKNTRSGEDSDCVICIDKLGTINIYICCECKNGFHKECVFNVVRCPLCRNQFIEEDNNSTIFD